MRLLQVDEDDDVTLTRDLYDNEIPRYAVISHTWDVDDDQVTFRDMQNDIGKDKPGYRKIEFGVQRVKKDGLRHFWLDTCCVDKTNNYELSKAINSMFRWYRGAERCYVYLADVPRASTVSSNDSGDWEADFRASRWFTRGWTLQELVAPSTVEFFSSDGVRLGDRMSLERQISDRTGIPVRALRGSPLSTFTVQERLMWQEGRQTKEPEDLYYSLLGMFDVSMPIAYGEGRPQARRRLKNEIDSALKGVQHEDFSVSLSLTDVVETPHLVGRELELQEMRQALTSDGVRHTVVLHGLGGMGKTQLAIAYAIRHRDSYSAIFWVNIKDEDSLKLSFAKIARLIAREHPSALTGLDNAQDLDKTVDAVKAWLSLPHNTRWLMINDNYDNPKVPSNKDPNAVDLRKFLPESHQGSVIVTTRSSEVNIGHTMRLRKLDQLHDSLRVLSDASRRDGLTNDPDAVELAKALDGLPLALATAGAYLNQTSVDFAQYHLLYDTSWAKLQKDSPGLFSYEDRTLYSTWQLSFDQIQKKNPSSAELLRLWAYLDNQDLWFELLHGDSDDRTCFPKWLLELTEDKIDFISGMRVLCDHGIVEADAVVGELFESRGYSIHSCVHSWTRTVLNPEWNDELAKLALRCVASHVPDDVDLKWWETERRLLTHVNKVLPASKDNVSIGDGMEWAHRQLGKFYNHQGKLEVAEAMYQRALHGHELQENEPSQLIIMHDLGIVYWAQGKLKEAETIFKRALQGKETVLGKNHTSTLDTVVNLGNVYNDQGRLEEAERMYQRALKGRETALGKDHTLTLGAVNNLGLVFVDQGRLDEAEAMFQRALHGREAAFGKDHTLTLQTVHNFGMLYQAQNRFEEAEAMYHRALKGWETALGKDHTETLNTVHNLGVLYRKQHRFEEAEVMYQRALKGRETALDKDHTVTLNTVIGFGSLYVEQGRLDEAETMYQRLVQAYPKMPARQQPYVDRLGAALRSARRSRDDGKGSPPTDVAETSKGDEERSAGDVKPASSKRDTVTPRTHGFKKVIAVFRRRK